MKQIAAALLFTLAFAAPGQAQRINGNDLRKASPEKRKELINSLSPEQRRDLIKQYRENIMAEELNISQADKQQFSDIYNRYQEEQRQIKEEFNSDFDPDKLSDVEAKDKLEQSFLTGQKLLESRRKYAREMQDILGPQQVLKMFQNEGRMREKIYNRGSEMRPDQSAPIRANPGLREGSVSRPNPGFRNPGNR